MSDPAQETTRGGHGLALLAILVGIVLGVLLGVFYGETMWMTSDLPAERLAQLRATVEQKAKFAADEDTAAAEAQAQGNAKEAQRHLDEAQRLRDQIPVVQTEIRRVEALADEAAQADLGTARLIADLVRFCGDVFLRMLFLIVIPLVVTSMICGITSLGDVRQMGKVGAWTMVYYFSTCAAAVVLGIFLVSTIRPGVHTDDTFAYVSDAVQERSETTVADTLLEVVRGRPDEPGSGMIPRNIFRAAGEGNVLALILFSLVFGGALSTLGERGRPAVQFFRAANDAVMKIVRMIIWLTPVGVFGLVATQIADSGGGAAFSAEVARLGWFVATVTIGLAVHAVVLCVVLGVFARRNPLRYAYQMARALLTAMSTDSSSATLPVTMQCTEEAGVSERSAGFVLPLGATINMDGTALYEATAAIFIAQSANIPLSGAALVIVFLTATLAAVGAPGIPSAGLVTLLIVLAAVDLPAAGIGTILAIDWFLDRERTMVNVFGDSVGAAVIDRHFGPE